MIQLNKLQQKADDLRCQGKTAEAIKIYHQIFKTLNNDKNYEMAGHAIQMIGVCYKIDNDLKNTIKYLEQAKKYYKKHSIEVGVGNTLRDIGIIWQYNKNYIKAKKYIEESIKVLKNTKDQAGYGISVAKLGLVYIGMKKYTSAGKEIRKSIKILQQTDNWFLLATAWGHLGELYLSMKKYDKVIESLEVAMRILDIKNQQHIMTRRYAQGFGMLANAYANLGEFSKAKKYFDKSMKLISKDFSKNAAKVICDDIRVQETQKILKK